METCKHFKPVIGQARKSLWIETMTQLFWNTIQFGQARKSLWIETSYNRSTPGLLLGQARKSLWIETFQKFRQ